LGVGRHVERKDGRNRPAERSAASADRHVGKRRCVAGGGGGKIWWSPPSDEVAIASTLNAADSAAHTSFSTDAILSNMSAASDEGAFFIAQATLLSGPISLVHFNAANTAELGRVSLSNIEGVPAKFPSVFSVAAITGKAFVLAISNSPSVSHALFAIDTSAHTLLTHVTSPVSGHAATADVLLADATHVYATDAYNHKLYELDTATLGFKRTIDLPSSASFPSRRPVIGGNALWAAGRDAKGAYIQRVDLTTGAATSFHIDKSLGDAIPSPSPSSVPKAPRKNPNGHDRSRAPRASGALALDGHRGGRARGVEHGVVETPREWALAAALVVGGDVEHVGNR